MEIAQKVERFRFEQGDSFEVLSRYGAEPGATFLLDPPYKAGGKRAGTRLYRHWEVDHASLFEACCHLRGDFLMTYDDAPEIQALAEQRGLEVRRCLMSGSSYRQMPELLFGRDLAWMDIDRLLSGSGDGRVIRNGSGLLRPASGPRTLAISTTKHDCSNEKSSGGDRSPFLWLGNGCKVVFY